jgi:hypothetical protein
MGRAWLGVFAVMLVVVCAAVVLDRCVRNVSVSLGKRGSGRDKNKAAKENALHGKIEYQVGDKRPDSRLSHNARIAHTLTTTRQT